MYIYYNTIYIDIYAYKYIYYIYYLASVCLIKKIALIK